MGDFDYGKLADRTWDNEILSYVSQIHEYKGKQELYIRQKSVELERLIKIAKIQSTESSNRIEGIVTTNARLTMETVEWADSLHFYCSCYREFEERINAARKSGVKSTSYGIVKEYALNKIGIFTMQDALIACPSLGSSSVEAALKKLVADGTIARMGAGRNTHYVRSDALKW